MAEAVALWGYGMAGAGRPRNGSADVKEEFRAVATELFNKLLELQEDSGGKFRVEFSDRDMDYVYDPSRIPNSYDPSVIYGGKTVVSSFSIVIRRQSKGLPVVTIDFHLGEKEVVVREVGGLGKPKEHRLHQYYLFGPAVPERVNVRAIVSDVKGCLTRQGLISQSPK